MRFKDKAELGTRSREEVMDELFTLSQNLRASTTPAPGPARLKLDSGEVIEGEVAEMWQRFQEGIIRVLETAVYHLEREK